MQVAKWLGQLQEQEGSIVSRHGGDEFAVFCAAADEGEAERKVLSLHELLSASYLVDGHELFVTPSIGVAMADFSDRRDVDVEALVRQADAALQVAKEKGRNTVVMYDESISEENYDKIQLTAQLRKAIETEELQLDYHPRLDTRTRRHVGDAG